jgi:hypothetical protein
VNDMRRIGFTCLGSVDDRSQPDLAEWNVSHASRSAPTKSDNTFRNPAEVRASSAVQQTRYSEHGCGLTFDSRASVSSRGDRPFRARLARTIRLGVGQCNLSPVIQ